MHEQSRLFLDILARKYAVEQLAFLLGYRGAVEVPIITGISRTVVLDLVDGGYLEPKLMGERSKGWKITSKAFDNSDVREWHEKDFIGQYYGELVNNFMLPTEAVVKMVRDIQSGKARLILDDAGNHWCRKVAAPQIEPDDRDIIVGALSIHADTIEWCAPRASERARALAKKIAAGEVAL